MHTHLHPHMHALHLLSFQGVGSGISAGWGGLLTQILTTPRYTSKFTGLAGFFSSVGQIFSSVLIGVVSDTWFTRRLKILLVVMYVWTALATLVFTLALPTPFFSSAPLPGSEGLIMATIVLMGVFQGAADPLVYEMCAEVIGVWT